LSKPLVRELIDAGVHFGHRVSRWNPKMAPYILGKRGLVHIIDIKETLKGLLRAKKLLARIISEGNDVLFVGTKRQAREIIRKQAQRCEMPYVSERWLGGTLTNFRTIRSRLARLEELEALDASGAMSGYSKKMESSLKRERRKIQRNLEGIRKMSRLPGALVLVDVRRENIAIREAIKLKIPTVALLDTDGDPDLVDLPIPCNDDAMRAIEIIIGQLVDAVMQGNAARTAPPPEEPAQRPARRRSSRATARAKTEPPAPSAEPTAPGEAPAAEIAEPGAPATVETPPAEPLQAAAETPSEPEATADDAQAAPAQPAQAEPEGEPKGT
jgi:small subunit ribosomal protein S2